MLNLKNTGWYQSAVLLRLLNILLLSSMVINLLVEGFAPAQVHWSGSNSIFLADIFWYFMVPVIPVMTILATGVWRNICPLSALNSFGFKLKQILAPGSLRSQISMQESLAQSQNTNIITRSLASASTNAYKFLRQNGTLVSLLLFCLLAPARLIFDDHNYLILGSFLAISMMLAFVSGLVFPYKSGWCSSICPLYAVEQMYGQSPFVKAENEQCLKVEVKTQQKSFCSGCVSNCLDRKVAPEDNVSFMPGINDPRVKVLLSIFPGFVMGFNIAELCVYNVTYPLWLRAVIVFACMLSFCLISRYGYLFTEAYLLKTKQGLEARVRLPRLYTAASFILYFMFRIPHITETLSAVLAAHSETFVMASQFILMAVVLGISALWYRLSLKSVSSSL